MNVCGIIGRPGCGKSTYLKRLVEAHRRPTTRFFVPAPYEAVRGVDVGTVDGLLKRPRWPPVARIDDDADRVLDLAMQVTRRTVVVDEAPAHWPMEYRYYDPVTKRWRRDAKGSPLERVCRRGREPRVFLIWVAQDPWDVHVLLRRFTTRWILFGGQSQDALGFYARTCGEAVTRALEAHTGNQPLIYNAERDALHVSE